MTSLWSGLVAVAAIASTVVVDAALDASKFVPADMNDPMVNKTAQAFLDEYAMFMGDVFAVVPEKKILHTLVYEHPIEIDEADDVEYLQGYTYKLNVLFKLTWDSPSFRQAPYVTVGQCIYACMRIDPLDRESDFSCEGKQFGQVDRVDQPVATIDVPRTTNFIHRFLHHTYDDAEIKFTAYETQDDSGDAMDDAVEYFQFQVDDEPIKCEAVVSRKGLPSQEAMLYFDDACFQAKYKGLSLAEFEQRRRADMAVAMSGFLVLGSAIAALVVFRRQIFTTADVPIRPLWRAFTPSDRHVENFLD
ncbi:unnamed protein product [Aphanomyces euteiches]